MRGAVNKCSMPCFSQLKESSHTQIGGISPFGSRLTYARLGVSLYAGYSHMRVAAVIICLWSQYGGRKPFYAVEWGNDRLCREMADTVILAGQGRAGAFFSILYQICTRAYCRLSETLDIPCLFRLSLHISAIRTTLSTGTTFVFPSS